MKKSCISPRRTVLAFAMPLMMASHAHAEGTVTITFSDRWLTGTISGLSQAWEFDFVLSGTFDSPSSTLIDLSDPSAPSLDVKANTMIGDQYFVFKFLKGGTTPEITISDRRVAAEPLLQVFNGQGVAVQTLHANLAQIGVGTDLPISNVPEPSAGMLLSLGLLIFHLLSRRGSQPRIDRWMDGDALAQGEALMPRRGRPLGAHP